jgi:hypothetical protein
MRGTRWADSEEDSPGDCGGGASKGGRETRGSTKGTRLQSRQKKAAREQSARARAEQAVHEGPVPDLPGV